MCWWELQPGSAQLPLSSSFHRCQVGFCQVSSVIQPCWTHHHPQQANQQCWSPTEASPQCSYRIWPRSGLLCSGGCHGLAWCDPPAALTVTRGYYSLAQPGTPLSPSFCLCHWQRMVFSPTQVSVGSCLGLTKTCPRVPPSKLFHLSSLAYPARAVARSVQDLRSDSFPVRHAFGHFHSNAPRASSGQPTAPPGGQGGVSQPSVPHPPNISQKKKGMGDYAVRLVQLTKVWH